MMNAEEVLACLRATEGLPTLKSGSKRGQKVACRTIYEWGAGPKLKPSGHFQIDYASFPGGSVEEVPLAVIHKLESEGLIKPAFPEDHHVHAWVLTEI